MTGYEKLLSAVKEDVKGRCFNPDGCDKGKDAHAVNGCMHKYCDKFAWVLARAKHYAEKTGLAWEKILDAWENGRTYWYMNYYHDCEQPLIEGDCVRVFETIADVLASVGKKQFRCPACGGVSTDAYDCNSGKEFNGNVCNWKVYGVFKDLGKGVYVFCKDEMRGNRIFMPLAWEQPGEK
jgi:hypothetical protein